MSSSSSDDSEYMDIDVSDLKIQNKQRAQAVSAEADQVSSDFTPPVHAKSVGEATTLRAILEKNVLFSSIDPRDIERIVFAFERVHVKKGDVLINQGDEGDCLYVVEEGSMNVYKRSPDINQESLADLPYGAFVNVMTSGQAVGELALLYTVPRAATVVAAEDSILHKLDRETFNFIVKGAAIRKRDSLLRSLKSMKLLKECDPVQLVQLADAASTVSVAPETFITREGEQGDAFYILLEGTAEAHKGGICVYKYNSGDYFGELALLSGVPRAASVVATSPSILMKIDVASFNRLLEPLQEILKEHPTTYSDQPV